MPPATHSAQGQYLAYPQESAGISCSAAWSDAAVVSRPSRHSWHARAPEPHSRSAAAGARRWMGCRSGASKMRAAATLLVLFAVPSQRQADGQATDDESDDGGSWAGLRQPHGENVQVNVGVHADDTGLRRVATVAGAEVHPVWPWTVSHPPNSIDPSRAHTCARTSSSSALSES